MDTGERLGRPRVYVAPVLEHFLNPRNVGEITDADGVGVLGDPACGDHFKVWIRVQDGILAEVKYKVFGCPAAVATCSMMSELATGKTVDEAYELDDLDILVALGGLPEAKEHCSNHAATALHKAIEDYVFRKTNEERGRDPR
ncbi:MAG: iron-sulfur cluster assembly scaffold protein [Actinobacteria bacterium]|nr:iron-sulfur cluster assembly scaffold protein [Actinomycetota bacterium]